MKEAVCTCISTFLSSFLLYLVSIPRLVKYIKSTFLYMNIIKIKNNKYLVQILYTFHLSIHHANFGQFKAKQVLYPMRGENNFLFLCFINLTQITHAVSTIILINRYTVYTVHRMQYTVHHLMCTVQRTRSAALLKVHHF